MFALRDDRYDDGMAFLRCGVALTLDFYGNVSALYLLLRGLPPLHLLRYDQISLGNYWQRPVRVLRAEVQYFPQKYSF